MLRLTGAWLTSIEGAVSSNLIPSGLPNSVASVKAVAPVSCREIESEVK